MAHLIFTKYHGVASRIENDTLLGRFIQDKMDTYIEPERKGTSRGDEIGLSRKKYEASLYNMTNLKIKYLSKILNVSYGLLRKWRTEDSFKDTIERHTREFAARFCDFVETFVAERLESEGTGEWLAEAEHDELHAVVRDGGAYGPLLCEKITATLEKRVAGIEERKRKGAPDRGDDAFLEVVKDLIMNSGIRLNSRLKFFVQVNQEYARLQEEHLINARERGATIVGDPLELVRKVLDFEELSDDEREQAIALFQHLLDVVKG